ncbi:HAD hydrolase-like protein [Kamptonema cortianum]|nr:HAD hydrolase-like protein [Kamptonema cortianum]
MPDTRKLLLWDIDGTLLTTGGAGVNALATALRREFHVEFHPTDGDPDIGGRTDKYIASALLKRFGHEASESNIHRFLEAYLEELPKQLASRPGTVLAGVADILEEVTRRPHLAQGLLTGNLRRGAGIKLSHYRIHHFFEFGAFADDSALRNELGPHARRRAGEYHDCEFAPENVFVIGDTPHDIECGKAIGARTIAVATGAYSLEQLAAHDPTAVFADFRDEKSFFDLVDPAA